MTNALKSVSPAAASRTPSAATLFKLRDQVLTLWVHRVKTEVAYAQKLLKPVIINTIPLFLENLAEALCDECIRTIATESSNSAQEHGGERARVTPYGPEQIIQEYQILRDVVREVINGVTSLTERDESTIQKSFDRAIQESMIAFFLVHGRIREQFIATLTHDLRNPIGAMKMASDLIIESANEISAKDLGEDILDLAQRISKNAKRADRMIQDMLDASVVQIGERLAIKISSGDIQDIIREAVGERPPSEKARLVVNSISCVGHWDLDTFQRSIENLIGNAFKYGGDQSPVTIQAVEMHERLIVSVHNEGNPIPAEKMESLFQVFRRADSEYTSGKQGWGIGLALARTTAERMGGSLGAESSVELGTTFSIDVPVDARPFIDAPTSEG